jgi:hypothetical protein
MKVILHAPSAHHRLLAPHTRIASWSIWNVPSRLHPPNNAPILPLVHYYPFAFHSIAYACRVRGLRRPPLPVRPRLTHFRRRIPLPQPHDEFASQL